MTQVIMNPDMRYAEGLLRRENCARRKNISR
jgi:hypothetical protein